MRPPARLTGLLGQGDLAVGASFVLNLPSFLRRPITPEQALAIVRRRLERREADWLEFLGRAVYRNPGSPYRYLLRFAGCEYGDVQQLVGQDGIEGALQVLCERGVYLTIDEFKGRKSVARGSLKLDIEAASLRNPCSTSHLLTHSGGSRGVKTPVPMDLRFIRDRAVNDCLVLDARGGRDWIYGHWGNFGAGTIVHVLRHTMFGATPVRSFSQVDLGMLHPRYRWCERAIRWVGLLAGASLPRPIYVPLEHSEVVADWMAEVLRTGRTPHVTTFPSSAVRLCQAALASGKDLRGAQFKLSGEPLTPARMAVIQGAGATAACAYGSMEAGPIAEACLAPDAPDDVHLLRDFQAVIQPTEGSARSGLPARAMLVSSLRPSAPLVLLNVSLGDQAEIVSRDCDCPLARLGWTEHLRMIRSYEKLTSEGVTFLDADVVRVLEEVLPARFGGGPTDYQLLEEEADGGLPRLRLLVHSGLGSLDLDAVGETFLLAIGNATEGQQAMAMIWRQAGLLRVERGAPRATRTGKILHLHLNGRSPRSPRREPLRQGQNL